MSKTKWTNEQLSAITEGGNNIIVSAGAGSGKTAVLTERILEKLKQGISLDSLIVLTFTNAAAFEMKERVRNKLCKEIENGNTNLSEQLDLLDSANICTFDSFSLSLVKKYHYLLGLEKNVNICDTVVLITKKKQILNEVFQDFFEKEDASFLNMIDTFSIKDDQKMQNVVYKMAEGLNAFYDKETYIDTYLDVYYDVDKIKRDINVYTSYIEKEIETVLGCLERIECKITDEKLREWYEKVASIIEPLRNQSEYDHIVKYLPTSIPSFPSSKKIDEDEKKEVKEEYESLKKSFNIIKQYCTYASLEDIIREIMKTKPTVSAILSLVKEYEKRVLAFKKMYNVFEFSDIGRFGIQLLQQHPEIRDYYKRNIHEIMVDEYQDTNDIGDYFISLLANQNVYMVGDVKQSIYGFRNANPSIFMEKYESYKDGKQGIKIDLMKNFRSRKEVLDSINFIFERIMDLSIGGASYKDGHEMIFGNQAYEKEGKNKEDHFIEVLDYPYEKGEYRKEEVEAFLIAHDIQKKIKEGYTVLDKETGCLRPASYQDFTILMDRKTDFDLYKKIFTYLEIPLYIHKEESFLESDEMYVIQNILKILLCIKEKNFYDSTFAHSFLSVARSFIFSYSDDDIFTIFLKAKEENESIYSIWKQSETFASMYEKVDLVYHKMPLLSLQELLEEIYITFDFYNKIIEIGEVELLSSKLHYLLDVSASLEMLEYTLEDFIDYFDLALKHQLDITFKMEGKSEEAVSMMTIHKSKGLEFPVCYYSGLYKAFSKEDFKDRFLFNHVYGIVTPVFEEGLKDTIYKTLVKEAYYKKDVAEKIRLLYVALTRAKEKMILVSHLNDAKITDEEGLVSDDIRLKYRSFYDMFASIKSTLMPYIKTISLDSLSLSHAYEYGSMQTLKMDIPTIKSNICPIEIEFVKETQTKKSFSVVPGFLTEVEQKNIEIGKEIHAYLEKMDFHNRNAFYDTYHISDFYIDKIEGLFEIECMKNIENSIFYKEYEFIDGENNHGIIDLLIERENGYVIIDYKLKEIHKESYYSQVRGYMEYIKKITKKSVEGYLYSLLDKSFIEVKDIET